MGGEGPTLSQAEKKRQAAEKQAAAAAAREADRLQRAETAQAEAASLHSLEPLATLSKKELKAQQKARKKQMEEERRAALGGTVTAERKPEVNDHDAALAVDVSDDAASASPPGSVRTMGHSTHCTGLKQVMVLLAKRAAIKEVIAGKLHEVRSQIPQFELRLQRDAQTTNARFKFVARKGHTAQDVAIEFNTAWLEACVQSGEVAGVAEVVQVEVDIAVDEFLGKTSSRPDDERAEKDVPTDVLHLGGKNLSGSEMQRAAGEKSRAAHKEQHAKVAAKQSEGKQAEAARQAEKALRAAVRGSSSDGKVDVAAHAERNAALISGASERGKYSFR